MSVTALEPAVSRPALRDKLAAALARESLVIGLVAAWTIALTVATWATWGDLRVDTGYDLLAGSRVAGGQLPYIDFDYWYGPLPAFMMGGTFAVLGTSVGSAIALGLGLSFTIVALAYVLARRFAGAPAAGAVAALTAVAALGASNINFVLPHALSAPLATAFGLLALIALTGERRRPALAGASLGLVAITRVEFAIALYAAVGVWFALRLWHDRLASGTRREALLTALGAIVIPAVVYGAFLTQISLHDLITVNLYPTAFLDQGGSRILEAHAPMTIASFAKLLGYGIVYAAGLAALQVTDRVAAHGRRFRTALLIGAAGIALLALVATVARPDTVRFYLKYAYGWVPLGAGLAAAWGAWLLARRRGGDASGAVLLSLLVAALAANTYADFNPQPKQEFVGATAYLLPIVAVFIAWLHVSVAGPKRPLAARAGVGALVALALVSGALVVHDAREETFTVHGPGGSLKAAAADGPAYQAALDTIARTTKPGEPVLLAPQMTSLYILADRPDPLPQLSLLPGALPTVEDERRAIKRSSGVTLVVTDRTPLDLYGQGAFGATYDTELGAWLRRDFRRDRTLEGAARTLDIWRRSPQ
jgi:hypothetical protein